MELFYIFTQKVKCKGVQETCPHTRDQNNPAENLDPMMMSCMRQAEDLGTMTMYYRSLARG